MLYSNFIVLMCGIVSALLFEVYADDICTRAGKGNYTCCIGYDLKSMPARQKACVKLSRVPNKIAIKVAFLVNDKKLAEKTLNAEGKPVCVPVGSTPVSVCMIADELTVNSDKKSGKICPSIFIQVLAERILKQKLPCMVLDGDKLIIVKD